jgi:SET domain-containing protein
MTLLIVVIIILIIERVLLKPVGKFPIELRESSIHNRGIFATRDIKCTELIEYVPVIPFNRSDVKPDTILLEYDIGHIDGTRYAMMLGYGAIYNHKNDNNANWNFIDDQTIAITANRDIKKDDEIFVNYGSRYWEYRGIDPK